MDKTHPRHVRALATLQVAATRRRKGLPIEVVVPTTVRVEAGWSRTAPQAALINLLRIRDAELDRTAADTAAALVTAHGVSVADAHLGAVIAARHGDAAITVVTSDPDDMRVVAESAPVTVFRL